MNDVEFKGDLYYVDPNGNSWRITQRPGERNPKQHYWHADRVVRPGETLTPREGHRVSASAYRLLIGIDGPTVESENDGSTPQDSSESDSESDNASDPERYGVGLWQFHTDAQNCINPGHPQACRYPADIENRRQAYLG